MSMDYHAFATWASPGKGLGILDWIYHPGLALARHVTEPTITETFSLETGCAFVESGGAGKRREIGNVSWAFFFNGCIH